MKKIEKEKTGCKFEKIVGYILLGFIMIFPWITFEVNTKLTEKELKTYIHKIPVLVDQYMFSKMYILLTVIALIIVAVLIHVLLNKKKISISIIDDGKFTYKDYIYAALMLFVVLAVLSTMTSEYRDVALFGNYNNPEGLFVLLSYIILFAVSAYAFRNQELFGKFIKTIIILGIITIILSYVEFYYKPLSKIIYPVNWQSDYKNMVSLMFFNSGYFGSFLVLIFPIVFGEYLKCEKNVYTIFLCLESVLLLTCVVFSKITAAFYVIIIELVLFLIRGIYIWIRSKKINKNMIYKCMLLAVMILAVGGMDMIFGGKGMNQLTGVMMNETDEIKNENHHDITNIEYKNNELLVESYNSGNEKEKLKVQLLDNQIKFLNEENGLAVKMHQGNNTLYFEDGFDGVTATIENQALVLDYGYKGKIRFYMYNDNFYPMLSDGSLVKDISGSGLKGEKFTHFATGRGYIWINSLPILKQTLFLGKGPATFGLYFKQFDFVGLLNSQGTVDLFIDKPHNMYIQTAEQTGMISAFALLSVFLVLLYKAFVDKKIKGAYTLGTSICGFLIIGIVNDSCITVSPVFWIFSGVLFAKIFKETRACENEK